MGNRIAWIILALLLAAGGIGLFWVQNSARTTQLSFDLGIAAWQLREPVPVPVLIFTCAVIGAVVAGVPLMLRSWRLSGRVGELEQRLAVAELERSHTSPSGGLPSSTAAPKEPGTW